MKTRTFLTFALFAAILGLTNCPEASSHNGPSSPETVASSSDYPTLSELFRYASGRLLTYEDIAGLNTDELRILRNFFYARHGYIFKSDDLRRYFASFDWYHPISHSVTLNKIEKYNVDFIKKFE